MIESIMAEYRRMIDEKWITIVLIIVPIIVNLLLGFQFSRDQVQNVPMAVIDQDNSSLSRMIVQQFSENEIFNVKYHLDDSNEIKRLIENNIIRVGMIIPKGFSSDITNQKNPTILMIYDGSHMTYTSAAKTRATEILLTIKTGIGAKVIGAKLGIPSNAALDIAQPIQINNRTLYNPTKSFKNFINPGFGVAIVQSAIVLLAGVCIRKEEMQGGFREKIKNTLGKIMFYSIIGTISFMICILIQNILFFIPFRGSYFTALILSFFMAVSVATFAIMISLFIHDKLKCSLLLAVIFLPSTVLVGYTFPLFAMPKVYQVVGKLMPLYHYGDNIRDLFLKGTFISSYLKDIFWFIKFIIVCIFFIGVGSLIDSLKEAGTISKISFVKEGGKSEAS